MAATAAVSLTAAPDASATGTSCTAGSGCDLYASPDPGTYYFSTPGSIPVAMMCWLDATGHRWFKVNSPAYGQFWAYAGEVHNQTTVGHC